MSNKNDYKGFCLFNDVENEVLKSRNRAVVLSNIAEANIKERRINSKGVALILGYFNQIPQDERTPVKERFKETMIERGFALAV
jgi:hypothetical protein